MSLYIDVGNSRIKWAQGDGEVHSLFYLDKFHDQILPEIVSTLDDVKRIYCSTVVRKDSVHNEILRLGSVFDCKVVVPNVVFRTKGLELCSAAYGTIGLDRWLIMKALTAMYPRQEIIVVSMGTAVTMDKVDMHGKHQGGFIQPGLVSAVFGLRVCHNLFPDSDFKFQNPKPACDTKMAMNNGVLALYTYYLDHLAGRNPVAKLVLTGGDAEKIRPLLRSQWDVQPNLVIKGLRQVEGEKYYGF